MQFHKDVFSELPVELLLNVTNYLGFQDFIVVRNVSRAWRERSSRSDFATEIVKMYFRTEWEQANLGDSTAKQALALWLPGAAVKRMRKQCGQYVSMSAYHYHLRGALLPVPIDFTVEHQYSSGRIAYKFDESLVVHSLNQGHATQPKIYTEPHRIPIRPGHWLLSNALLILEESTR
jgi:hypothetical protein